LARTTATLVGGIIEVDENITDLSPFLTAANELVTEVCVPAGYTDARLELIERYLAGHFYAMRDSQITAEAAGPVSTTYQGKVGLFLQNSLQGQSALALDTAGGLARLSKQLELGTRRRTVTGFWLGTKPCDTGA
jgi:hypothetical protein